MSLHRALATVAFLALLVGCMSPAATPPEPEPTQDRLSDHTRCDFDPTVDCARAARQLEVVEKLPDAVWLCTWYSNGGRKDSLDPYFFAVFYDPQAERHAIWFNFTYEGRLEPPGVWHMAFYMSNDTFYSFAQEGPTGFVVLPEMLPDGPYDFMFSRLNVTLGGALADGAHRVLWIREPVNDPNTGALHRTTWGAIHAVRADGTDYLFYSRAGFGSIGDRAWQGDDYSLNVWWSTHTLGSERFYPNPPSDSFGGVMTPYADATFCNDRPLADPPTYPQPGGRALDKAPIGFKNRSPGTT